MAELSFDPKVKETNDLAARALKLLADIVETNGYCSTLEVMQKTNTDVEIICVEDRLVVHCETILKKEESQHVLNLLRSFTRENQSRKSRG